MNKIIFSIIISFFVSINAFSQGGVGINNTGANPNANAMLDVSSNDKGILITRLTTIARTTLGTALGLGDNGMLVYDKDLLAFYYWDGTQWVIVGSGVGDNWGSQVVQTNGTNISGDGTVGNPLTVTDGDSDPNNEIELPATATNGQVLSYDGSNWVAQNPGSGADNWGTQVVQTNGTNISGDGTLGNPLTVTDGDSDPNNEIELPTTATSGQVLSYDGSNWVAQNPGSGADNWGNQAVQTNGTNITGDGTTSSPLTITEVDGSVTNEIQDLSLNTTTNILTITNNGSATNVDLNQYLDNTDAQDLSLSGNTLSLTNDGTTVDLSPLKDHDWYEVGGTTQPDAITDNIFTQGKVSIGFPNTTVAKLSIKDVGYTESIAFDANSDGNFVYMGEYNEGLAFGLASGLISGGNANMVLSSTGDVGIGTVSPLTTLDVVGSGTGQLTIASFIRNPASTLGKGSMISFIDSDNDIWRIGSQSTNIAGDNKFSISGPSSGITPHLTIEDATGYVGLFTNTPTERLEVQGSVKIVDGTEGVGKVLTSDATGKGSWQTPSTSVLLPVTYPSGTSVPDNTYSGTTGVNTIATFTAPSNGLFMVSAVVVVNIAGGQFGDETSFGLNSQTYFRLIGGGSIAQEEHLSEDATKQICISYLFNLTSGQVVRFEVGQQDATSFGFSGLEMRVVKF